MQILITGAISRKFSDAIKQDYQDFIFFHCTEGIVEIPRTEFGKIMEMLAKLFNKSNCHKTNSEMFSIN